MSWGRNARHGFDRALQTADKLKSAVVFFGGTKEACRVLCMRATWTTKKQEEYGMRNKIHKTGRIPKSGSSL